MSAYRYYDRIIEDESRLSPIIKNQTSNLAGRNLYTFKDNGEDLVLCHVPMFLPFARENGQVLSNVEFGMSMSPAVLMAMHHWNNGNGVIVDAIEGINKTCPIRFTTEIFDTEQSPIKVTRDFINLISRRPGGDEYIQPCAILGAVYSSVTRKFATLSAVYDLLQVSPASSSRVLDEEKDQYPLFARTVPSSGASGSIAVDYFHHLGVKKFAVVYADNDYGKAYNAVVKNRTKEYEMERFSFPIKAEDLTEEVAEKAMEEIKQMKINYIIGAFYGDEFDATMKAASNLGIAGPGNLWLFSDALAYSIVKRNRTYYEKDNLTDAVFGNAVIVDRGGAVGVKEYDSFMSEWQNLNQNKTSFNYINSKHSMLPEQKEEKLRNALSRGPNFVSVYSYEAIIGIGLSACNASNNQIMDEYSLFSGSDHHTAFLDINFQSASGQVTIAPGTVSRDSKNIIYNVANIIKIEEGNNSTTLKGEEIAFFDVKTKEWETYPGKTFIYSDGNETPPLEYVENETWKNNTTFLSILIVSLFVVLVILGYLGFRTIRKFTVPTVRVVSTGEIPNMMLPEKHTNHLFFSHVWKSGQAQTHAIVRKLQLYLPGIRIWLDVDSLDDIYDLEKSVAESVVFVLYYSPGYFQSKNCKREIYTAIKLNKPIILLYEGDESTIEDLEKECQSNCCDSDHNNPTSEQILDKLLGSENTENRILWLNEGSFSAASLNRIYFCLLEHLPYYQKYKFELRSGVAVPNEQVPVTIKEPINLLVQQRKYNKDFGEEMKDLLISMNEWEKFNVIDIDDFLLQNNDGIEIDIEDFKSSMFYDLSGKDSYFVLYLNKHTFEFDSHEEDRDLINLLRFCNDANVKILLVHEKDISKGACNFDTFYENAPPELLSPPIDLFHEIATPLHENEKYREVSIRILLMKMGGVPIKYRSGKWKVVGELSKSVKLPTSRLFRSKKSSVDHAETRSAL